MKRGTYQKPPSSGKRKNYLTIRLVLIILLVTNLISFMVWQNIKGLELDEKIDQMKDTQLKLHQKINEQTIEYERIRNDPLIEQKAKSQLGMVTTNKEDFIELGITDKYKLTEKFLASKKLDN